MHLNSLLFEAAAPCLWVAILPWVPIYTEYLLTLLLPALQIAQAFQHLWFIEESFPYTFYLSLFLSVVQYLTCKQ